MRVSRRALVRQAAGFVALLLNACAASGPRLTATPDPPTPVPPEQAAQPTASPRRATAVPTPSPPVAFGPGPAQRENPDSTETRYIAHTDGTGVRLRSRCADEPAGPGRWCEGTAVSVRDTRSDCPDWLHVDGPGGESSWVRVRYLSTVPPPTRASAPRATDATPAETLTIGASIRGRPIEAMQVGDGPIAVAFIGNIHGGWEPVARDVVEHGLAYFLDHPAEVPAEATLYFLPTMNPDGYEAGRSLWSSACGNGGTGDRALARTALNANGIDLNRNFPTNWAPNACGGERIRLVDDTDCRDGLGGPRPFSEPETQAYRDFILGRQVRWVLSYHEHPKKLILIREGGGGRSEPFAHELAKLIDYEYVPETTGYKVTGHAWDWLDAEGVTGAEIELQYRTLDWDRNLSGMRLAIRRAVGSA